MSANRQFKRQTKGEVQKMFKLALKESEKMESGIKQTVSKLPWYRRFVVALLIIIKRWK